MAHEFPITIPEARAIYDGLEEAEKGKLRLLAAESLHDWADIWNETAHEEAITTEVLAMIRFEDWKSLL